MLGWGRSLQTCRRHLALAALLSTSVATAETALQFDFGNDGNVGDAPYDAARGYGFEPSAADPQRIAHLADHLAGDVKALDPSRPDTPEAFTENDL